MLMTEIHGEGVVQCNWTHLKDILARYVQPLKTTSKINGRMRYYEFKQLSSHRSA